MADRNKFEEMLERLINEDKEGAEELFHEIVVEKSRDIYESLLESDLEEIEEESEEEVDESEEDDLDEASDEEVDESSDDEEVEEGFDLDEFEVEADPMDMGGDPADDMMGDIDDEEEGDDEEDEEGEEELEDRVMDLEDALDDLKAEFEKMMAGDDEGDMDDMGDDEEEPEEESFAFESEDEDEEVDEATDEDEVKETRKAKTAGEQMREYVEKVSATMGDNGANTKSTVAGANDMGGTTANIAKGGTADGDGKAMSAKEDSAGNVNVPGGKASKSMKSQPGHGAEKKGKPEAADNKKSTLGSK